MVGCNFISGAGSYTLDARFLSSIKALASSICGVGAGNDVLSLGAPANFSRSDVDLSRWFTNGLRCGGLERRGVETGCRSGKQCRDLQPRASGFAAQGV